MRSGWEGERVEQTQEEEATPSQGLRRRAWVFQWGSHTCRLREVGALWGGDATFCPRE